MIALRAAVRAAVVSVGALASCTQVSDRDRFEEEGAPLRILRTVPAAGAVDMAPDGEIAVCLSAPVDPRSIAPNDTAVSSGPALFDTELTVQLFAWTAPDGSAAPPLSSAPWCSGSVLSVAPQTTLTAGARYRLQLLPTLRGWAGERLDTDQPGWMRSDGDDESTFYVEFEVAPAEPPPGMRDDDETDDPPPTLTELFGPGGPFDPERAQCSCHAEAESLAFERLDLSAPEQAFDALLGSGAPRDTGFAMVAPRDPSQSFLIQKLLRDGRDAPLHGIRGDAMPPEAPLPYADMVAIARWIEGGAEI
ncbi:MAG: Ig-like domain-containing protein [Myxococcota bacterium]